MLSFPFLKKYVLRKKLLIFSYTVLKKYNILNFVQNKYNKFHCILCGDFNINLLQDSMNTKLFQDILNTFNFVQTIFEPTRVTQNSQSLLDNIFIKSGLAYSAEVFHSALSDHEAQIIKIHLDAVLSGCDSCPLVKRVFSQAKMRQFKQELASQDWRAIYQSQQAEEAYNAFISIFTNLINLVFPKKSIRKKNQKSKIWITQGIKISSKNKRDMYERMIKGEVTLNHYKLYSNILKRVVNEAKKRSNISQISQSDNPGKTIWDLVKA